ncbi:MAG: TIGR00282 family metallophosphoesterase [Alphaproteobacteria bacterium]
MRILFLGDVVGKKGREIALQQIPLLKESMCLDVVIANVENAAHGFGLTPKMYESFKRAGVNLMTMGNHTFDKKDIFPLLMEEKDIVRPANYPEGTIGVGSTIYTLEDGRKIGLVQVLGQIFMKNNEMPYPFLDAFYSKYRLGQDVQAIVVDVHAEATSEKMAMGFLSDGKASLVAGTHTHIPTADAMILPKGTGYITDIGMCGDYWSIIGMTTETVLPRFKGQQTERMEPAEEQGTLCAVFAETDDNTGLCKEIYPVRIGTHLMNTKI